MALRGGLANTGAGFVLFGSCFSVVLFVVRSSGFVLLVVLFVVRSFGRSSGRSSGRSFCGSFFWGLVCVFCSML